MLNQFYIHYIDFVKSKNQWMQIWKHAYDDVQLSEWSRQRSSYCMHFCHYTVFTHSLYCPLKVIKLKYILDTCSIYRFWRWTMDWYKKLIFFVIWENVTLDFFMTFFVEMLVISKISVAIDIEKTLLFLIDTIENIYFMKLY